MGATSKQILLSAEVSRSRALLAGGGSSRDILTALKRWAFAAPARGTRRLNESLKHWNENLCHALNDSIPLGAPIGRLLREVQPMIRKEERHWMKLQGIERQFAFQGGIAIVLPWGVASLSGGISLNWFSFAGAAFQFMGLFLFYFILQRATRRLKDEAAWTFDLLVSVWMRVLAGMGLHSGLDAALGKLEVTKYRDAWKRWISAYNGGAVTNTNFAWPDGMKVSSDVSALILSLLKSGAPAAEVLADCINQLDDERQALLEEKIAAVPTRLSLVFCAFFTPAVFLILMGSLWPTLRTLSI